MICIDFAEEEELRRQSKGLGVSASNYLRGRAGLPRIPERRGGAFRADGSPKTRWTRARIEERRRAAEALAQVAMFPAASQSSPALPLSDDESKRRLA